MRARRRQYSFVSVFDTAPTVVPDGILGKGPNFVVSWLQSTRSGSVSELSGFRSCACTAPMARNIALDSNIDFIITCFLQDLRWLGLPVVSRGIALGILRPRWADFAILDEMDSTGSRMIRGAGEGLGSLYRMLGRFGRPAHRQCCAARLS